MNCEFENRVCKRCGHRLPDHITGPVYRNCQPSGWGDRLARFFARLGIRKRAGCGCAKRQERLNRLGEWVSGLWRRK